MKALWKYLPLLLLVGCSADMATQPTAPDNATVQAQYPNEKDVPIMDIEPGDPLCETNNTGFAELTNPCRHAITCVIGNQYSFVVNPGETITEVIITGAHEIQWWGGCQGHYTAPLLISKCKTTTSRFEQAKANRNPAIQ
ncbi:MAG: hypothetical protein KDB65_00545 [Calditrichaeota bacterium]|nr:hypothetical protein [Calditrichota bacterium]MCB9368483.1 hypothetical protein [Calditrichota bacterium]